MAVHDDERGTIRGLLERSEARANHVQIVSVGDTRDVPAVGGETRADILGKRKWRTALDRDPVAVVDPAEV